MDRFNLIVSDLKKANFPLYNEQNFFTKADEDRYQEYLKQVVFKYVKNEDEVKGNIQEKNFGHDRRYYGLYEKDRSKCIIPVRKNLMDEMIAIHEITHLISHMSNNASGDSKCREVIPFFNEFDYLANIDKFYAEYYEKFRLYNAIRAAKSIKEENRKDYLPYIYAYFVLESRKRDYDIDRLNKINAKPKKLEKELHSKGYTVNL